MIQSKDISSTTSSNRKLKSKIEISILQNSNFFPLWKSLPNTTYFWNLVDITFQKIDFIFLPKELGALPHITDFEFTLESLKQILIRINLLYLNRENNSLTKIPTQITCLTNLTNLHLGHNKIISLPEALGTLPSLSALDLSHNYFGNTYSWTWLRQTPIKNNLLYLNISHNYLKQLPLEIIGMKNLAILDVSSNRIVRVLERVGKLSLRQFYLSKNYLGCLEINDWPWLRESGVIPNLNILTLKHNFLTKLPANITSLDNIRKLDLSYNDITSLPEDFGTLPLMVLDLSHNNLGKSTEHTWKWLEKNEIKYKLSNLYLSGNSLTEVPLQIGELKVLSILHLDQNKLTFLPHNIADIPNLNELNLSKNNLSCLPSEIGHLALKINIEDNPFKIHLTNGTELKMSCLVKCAAKVFMKSGINQTDVSKLPKEMVTYINDVRLCYKCNEMLRKYNYKIYFIKYPLFYNFLFDKFKPTKNIENTIFEFCFCSQYCARKVTEYLIESKLLRKCKILFWTPSV